MRILKFREEYDSSRYQDVNYESFIENPIETVKAIYSKFGYEYSQEFEDRMKEYLRKNRQGAKGRNSYSLSDYGLSQEQVVKEFLPYMKKFSFPIEEKV